MVHNTLDKPELKYTESPDIYSVLKKFQYEGWRDILPERYFI